jgi:hypothetical protein
MTPGRLLPDRAPSSIEGALRVGAQTAERRSWGGATEGDEIGAGDDFCQGQSRRTRYVALAPNRRQAALEQDQRHRASALSGHRGTPQARDVDPLGCAVGGRWHRTGRGRGPLAPARTFPGGNPVQPSPVRDAGPTPSSSRSSPTCTCRWFGIAAAGICCIPTNATSGPRRTERRCGRRFCRKASWNPRPR